MALGVELLALRGFYLSFLIDWWLLSFGRFEMGFLDVLITFVLELCT